MIHNDDLNKIHNGITPLVTGDSGWWFTGFFDNMCNNIMEHDHFKITRYNPESIQFPGYNKIFFPYLNKQYVIMLTR